MGRFDGVIIVTDLDGTFLGKNARLVPENLEAVEYFKREGGLFTVATGREHFVIDPAIPRLGEIVNAPVIACNGAYLYDAQSRRILLEEFLPEPDITRAVDAAMALNTGALVRFSGDGKIYMDAPYPLFFESFSFCRERLVVLPWADIPHGRWHKVAFEGTPEQLDAVRASLDRSNRDRYVCVYACPTILEVQALLGTKGQMLRRLKEFVGRPDALLYAVGDYENDVEMLSLADRRATPENGLERIKAMPGVIRLCHHDQGALAHLIRHIERHGTGAQNQKESESP